MRILNKRIATIIIAGFIAVLIMSACNRTSYISLPDDIDKVAIYLSGGSQTTFSYTDSEKIEKLTEYLTSLPLTPAAGVNEKEGILLGNGWEIKLFSGESVQGVNLHGNMYLQGPDGKWWKISEEPESEFEELLKSLVPDEMPKTPIFDE